MVSTITSRTRAWVEIDLAALVANYQTINNSARGAEILPMVKADAYGVGVDRVVETLEPLVPWGYGVATIDEAVTVRALGVSRPVMVFCPACPSQLGVYKNFNLTAVVDRPEVAAVWTGPFHLEVDTGMSRTGIRWDDPGLHACVTPQTQGVFTHFHSADERAESIAPQLERFEHAVAGLPGRLMRHVANSAAVFSVENGFDLVRPGVFLYGSPTRDDLPLPLPVVALKARVVSVREIREGDSVSYGGDWTARRDTLVATLGIGFGDGVGRSFSGRGRVLIAGVECAVIGRVTMDLTMVDVTELGPGSVSVGDEAVIVGSDGDARLSLSDYAEASQTSTYEVLTRLRGRLPRHYGELTNE